MAVVRAKYFDECLGRGVPFQDRANLPPEAFIEGKEVVDLWEDFGYAFLVIISYPWLSREHPDPQCYHLPRLVRALKAFRTYHDESSWGKKGSEKAVRLRELGGGVILDYCSFVQGERTEEEDRIFKEGLKLINIPYGHRDVTALKLTSTPDTEARRYDDRGWTHFESTVIDGKAPSDRDPCGERNVLTCGDAFTPRGPVHGRILIEMNNALRKPPLTPLRFREELELRRLRAEAKNERLFTNGKDSPVILERYDASFNEFCRSSRTLDYTGMRWGGAEAKELALVLPFFKVLTKLVLDENLLDGEAAAFLATALPGCRTLRVLKLSDNQLGADGEASVAFAAALGSCPALELVYLNGNKLGPEAELELAWRAAGKDLRGLFL